MEFGFSEEDIDRGITLYEPVGCARCERGFKGRFAILETMPLNDPLRRVIIRGGTALDIKDTALSQRMQTLRRVGLLNAMRGRTSFEEVLRVTMGD